MNRRKLFNDIHSAAVVAEHSWN